MLNGSHIEINTSSRDPKVDKNDYYSDNENMI